jgi:hypothetical protein
MKQLITALFTITALTMCSYAPAQTTQIITPDGKLVTCIRSGDLITCF